jgi:hypothetical protein
MTSKETASPATPTDRHAQALRAEQRLWAARSAGENHEAWEAFVEVAHHTVAYQAGCLVRGECCRAFTLLLKGTPVSGDKALEEAKKELPEWAPFFHLMDRAGASYFSCRNLRPDGRCGAYESRPKVCRDYPSPSLFVTTGLKAGCGYRSAVREPIPPLQPETVRLIARGLRKAGHIDTSFELLRFAAATRRSGQERTRRAPPSDVPKEVTS